MTGAKPQQTDRTDGRTAPALKAGQGRADRLFYLAGRVARLSPDHRDPERYHLEKSEIAATLRRMAREAGR